jgi:four helix bundle protein
MNNQNRAKVRTFRDLVVWQRGMELARAVYPVVTRMPPSQKFELASQMWRAAYSIPSNIAEGHARQTRPDYMKFLRIARGSLAELSTQFELAVSLLIIQSNPTLHSLIQEEDRILQALIMSLEQKTRDDKEKHARPR